MLLTRCMELWGDSTYKHTKNYWAEVKHHLLCITRCNVLYNRRFWKHSADWWVLRYTLWLLWWWFVFGSGTKQRRLSRTGSGDNAYHQSGCNACSHCGEFCQFWRLYPPLEMGLLLFNFSLRPFAGCILCRRQRRSPGTRNESTQISSLGYS